MCTHTHMHSHIHTHLCADTHPATSAVAVVRTHVGASDAPVAIAPAAPAAAALVHGAMLAGQRLLIAKTHTDGVLLEFWAHNRLVKVMMGR